MTIHNMDDSLAYSHGEADAPYWREVYAQAFPNMVTMTDLRANGWHQAAGRDRAITLSTGRTIYVDEKVRKKNWTDICIEVWSVYPRNGRPPWPSVKGAKPGWAVAPKDCDYLAYAFKPSQTCHLFTYFSILSAWAKHKEVWRDKAEANEDGYRWIKADNVSYWTVSVSVPINALHDYIKDALTITWTASAA
jgi:hypothetical protein